VNGDAIDAPPGATEVLTGTLRQGCVVALHMDEDAWTGAAGEVRDDCGGDNPGTLKGAANTVAGGVHGRAGSFNGSACIDIPDAQTLHGATGLTLSAWIFPTQLDNANANGVISKRIGMANQSEYNLYVWTNDRVYVDLDGENNRFNGVTTIKNNAWTQLTMVFDGSKPEAQRVTTYVNGKIDITSSESSASLTAYTSALHVGCMPAPTAAPPSMQYFTGQLDEVVIWNRALTDTEIALWKTNTQP
jgi:hypothetical protein